MSDKKVPISEKLFLNIEEAAAYAGLAKREVEEALHSVYPLPHFKVGTAYKIQRTAIEPYFAARCTGELR